MIEQIDFFSSLERLLSIAFSALVFYFAIIALVRLSGKRTTAQLNNFDWIITVAVGSLAASGILLRDISIADALAAIVALGFLQFVTTKWVMKSDLASKLFKAEPTLLTHKGKFLREAMQRTRISEEEILSVLRTKGYLRLEDANWVVLETNGELTVVPKDDATLEEVETMSDIPAPDDLPKV